MSSFALYSAEYLVRGKNRMEIQQAAREEKWVPKADIVKFSPTNMRIDPTMTPKEETYQVILDVIKNSFFFKAFLASTVVPEIYMQQFWHTVTKALDICPRVPGKEFIEHPSEKELLTFLVGLDKKALVSPKPASDEESDESDSKPARKWTGSRRLIKKKVSISADENIIPEPDVALELGKFVSLTEAAEEEEARQVQAMHERIVTESEPEPARRRPSGIAFRDTFGVSKKMSPDLSQKLKGVQTLTPKEQVDADTMQALKASRKSSKSQPHARGSSEGTGVPDKEKVTSEAIADVILDWGSKEESEYSKVKVLDIELLRLKKSFQPLRIHGLRDTLKIVKR
ncbi:hypothetical protein Tco_0294397 [Tanacetum coccineum]